MFQDNLFNFIMTLYIGFFIKLYKEHPYADLFYAAILYEDNPENCYYSYFIIQRA